MEAADPTKQVAIKGFRSEFNSEESIKNEIKIWRMLTRSHENILPLLGITTVSNYLSPAPVSRFYENGNVSNFVRKSRDMDRMKRLNLLIDVANGLQFIHGISIVHGDIKGFNIIVDDTITAKICDFGSSIIDCNCNSMRGGTEGSIWWDSPELWEDEDENRTKQSDVWALGCLAVEA
ncbi:hypothetical protein FRC06_008377, partial [Ceratobasidium sp. 370]